MWVLKLGGSLLGQPELKSWLTMLAGNSDGRVLIVPGGGVFADAVRDAQGMAGYDDAAAHRMALLAMEQFGLVMKSLQPDLATVASELEIAERSWQHRAMIWMPSAMVLADEAIPMNWSVTSDSLAAWLAAKLGADRLVLVKQVDAGRVPVSELVAEGVLDEAFESFATRLACPIDVVDKASWQTFASALAANPIPCRMK